MENTENVDSMIDEKVSLALELIDKLESNYSKVEGAIKTKRFIEKELKFLQRVCYYN